MPVLDTSELIERLKRGEEVADDITVVSLVEYPKVSVILSSRAPCFSRKLRIT